MAFETKMTNGGAGSEGGPTSQQGTQNGADVANGVQQQPGTDASVDIAIQDWSRPSPDLSDQFFFVLGGSNEAEALVVQVAIPVPDTELSMVPGEAGARAPLVELQLRKTVEQMQDTAAAEAEALVQLVDQLSGKPLTSENESAWLKVLEDFEPGPFSKYVVEKIGNAAIQEGPVRSRLLEIKEAWQSKHGAKPFHAADLDQLSSVLSPPPSQGFISRLLELGRRLNPFS